MRKIYLILLLVVSISGLAQNKQVLYNFATIPQSLLVNPGTDISYKYYFGVPLLSGISANVGSSSFSAYDLFANNRVDFNTKLRNAVNKASKNDIVSVNEQIELFSGGFKLGGLEDKGYISFGIYQEADFFMYVPKDLALLALDGNQNYIGKRFDLSQLSVKAEVLSVFHVGYHKKINNKLILGGRAKLYSSGLNATSTKNSGYIYTGMSNTTMYNQIISSNLELKSSGIAEYLEDDYDGSIASDIAHKTFLGGNYGIGFDAGITYYPKKNIQFTASIIDVGFIRHSKEVENFTYKGYYQYEGVNPNFTNPDKPENVFDEFEAAIPRDTLYNKYTTWRPVKFNSSIQYSFGKSRSNEECNCKPYNEIEYLNGVGVQLFAMSTPRSPLVALTAFYRRTLFQNLQVKATYTIDSYSSKNIGFGFSTTLGKFNVYAMIDNILEYKDITKANSATFQFGLNFIFKENSEYN
ncbi:DUF5723 family protein [Flavobacterium sp. 140616W15]|uniref:DUF5723 family protein n=1 Tax=Flavobacterium sp. 140616W15 TaxID=2478552 RepID=UPI000F0C450F|nr:DUF5723 family protein [Flavobacterium sp. 140616W15]AYN03029.1 hypothetical protein EAG11_01715 [Flavobacterium sp. 140616W15]